MTRFERLFVWTGGALFVASLAGTAWWYIAWLGRARPWTSWAAVVFDAVLFSVFALHHSALARPSAKAALTRVCPERLLRSVYVWTASVLLMIVCLFWRPVGGLAFHVQGLAAGVHIAAQVAGLTLIALSVRAIDGLELAGIRSRAGQRLRITSPYHLVRHPLYLGWMLVVFGTARMTGDRLAFAVMSSLYVIVGARWEEQSLGREFGSAYQEYREKVRWRIIPYIY